MREAAEGLAEAGSGLRQKVGVCGEGVAAAEGGAVYEGGGSEFVGVERWGVAVAAAVGGAVEGGAYERGRASPCQAQRGKSGAQRLSAAGSGGFAASDGGMGAASAAAPAAAVCGVQHFLRFFLHCLLHPVSPLQLHLC